MSFQETHTFRVEFVLLYNFEWISSLQSCNPAWHCIFCQSYFEIIWFFTRHLEMKNIDPAFIKIVARHKVRRRALHIAIIGRNNILITAPEHSFTPHHFTKKWWKRWGWVEGFGNSLTGVPFNEICRLFLATMSCYCATNTAPDFDSIFTGSDSCDVNTCTTLALDDVAHDPSNHCLFINSAIGFTG